MFSPLFYVAIVCGLLAGGSIASFEAPTRWLVSGLDAPRIMQAQACAMEVLQ